MLVGPHLVAFNEAGGISFGYSPQNFLAGKCSGVGADGITERLELNVNGVCFHILPVYIFVGGWRGKIKVPGVHLSQVQRCGLAAPG